MARVFISYRRDDSAGYAGRLFDWLKQRWDDGSILMDIETITPGEDFVVAKKGLKVRWEKQKTDK
jgi:hypothetical protein